MRPVSVLFLSIVAAAVVAACSSNQNDTPTTAKCPDLYDPGPTFDFSNPQVSFKNDVAPIFARGCAQGTCHGNPTTDNNGIYIGEDATVFIAGAVGVDSGQLPPKPPAEPGMKFVAKGDPKNSFLMHKIDGTGGLCALTPRCLGKFCGQEMPQNLAGGLPQADRDTVRRWIAQGANNN